MLSRNAIRVLERRYLRRDRNGRPIESPRDLFVRVAATAAAPDATHPYEGRLDPERTAREFLALLTSLEFLPNSPTLMNAGRDLPQLAACFVLPVEDSMEGIFDSLKQTALIHKTGGGTGFSFSRLRPRNSPVRSTDGIASGPVSFMRVFNAATEAVKQGGARRGANMGILRVDHPDILEFIRCKRDMAEIANFNISVAVTEGFVRAVLEGRDYELVNTLNGRPAGRLDAAEVFEEIVRCAWRSGDPGIVFIDRINEANPTRHVAPIEATNPCGEQPLMPYESCVLGSINLSKMVRDGGVDWRKLARVTRTAVHFLDNLIEAGRYPLGEIERVTKANRRIGVGVMGWADMLIRLRIPYDSTEALNLAGQVMGFIDRESKKASADLAADRGPFENWPGSSYDLAGGPRLRNATTTTVAPAGSISIIAGTSSGIEPLFAIAYTRRHVLDDEKLTEVHPLFERIALERGFHSEPLMRRVAAEGSVQRMEDVPGEVKRLFVTAHDISAAWHVRMQAAFQACCDNGVSKTVNLPKCATPDDVREVFLLAYMLGCKGVTVFRDGCRGEQVLNLGADAADEPQVPAPPEQDAADDAATLISLQAGPPQAGPITVPGPVRSNPPPDRGSRPTANHRVQDGVPSSAHLPLTEPSAGRGLGNSGQGEPHALPLPRPSPAE